MSAHGHRTTYLRGCRCNPCRAIQADYQKAYRIQRKGRGGVIHGGAISGGVMEGEFPRCYWREDLSEPIHTVDRPYGLDPDGDRMVFHHAGRGGGRVSNPKPSYSPS